MSIFKVAEFDHDLVGDKACENLFSQTTSSFKSKQISKRNKRNKIKQTVLKNKIEQTSHVGGKKQQIKKIMKKIVQKNSQSNFNLAENTNGKQKNIPKLANVELKRNKNVIQKKRVDKNDLLGHNISEKKKNKDLKKISTHPEIKNILPPSKHEKIAYVEKKNKKVKGKLEQILNNSPEQNVGNIKKRSAVLGLRERMMQKLKSARFRYLNEEIYSNDSKKAQNIFKEDPQSYQAYHEGYRIQVSKWPINPLDVIIKSVKKMPKGHVIADFGCGEAKLAASVAQKVHSFDLVASNDTVTACDMSKVPLSNASVDVVVFCLSLMGTNLRDYLLEANRVLKLGGVLKVAEVESRFDDVNLFLQGLERFHFKNTFKDLSHNLFYFMDFKKESNIKNKNKLPTISLHPCLYKKR